MTGEKKTNSLSEITSGGTKANKTGNALESFVNVVQLPQMDRYYTWLKDKTAWKNINEWVEITTPYIDRNNDYIQIYLKKTEDGYLLTDDGATILGLKEEGCMLDSSKHQELLVLALNGYGVSLVGDKLQVTATTDNFAWKKHSIVQAILTVNDMYSRQ
jgi:hypothetical protein